MEDPVDQSAYWEDGARSADMMKDHTNPSLAWTQLTFVAFAKNIQNLHQ